MDNSKSDHALLGVAFLKQIGEEAELLSSKASCLLEDVDKCPMVDMLSPELLVMHMSLQTLGALCKDVLQTCVIDEDIVRVPHQQFLSITDASRSGVAAYKEALKYISFVLH